MEPKFKTSFIPKQSLANQVPSKPVHKTKKGFRLGTVLALLILVVSLGLAGFAFFYTTYLEGKIESQSDSLRKSREAFSPELLQELKRFDNRLQSASEILDQHIAPSGMYALVEEVTLKSVQFNSFTFNVVGNDIVQMDLTGTALDLDAVALQADVFEQNNFISSPVISDIIVNEDGTIGFSVIAQIQKDHLDYSNFIFEQANEEL